MTTSSLITTGFFFAEPINIAMATEEPGIKAPKPKSRPKVPIFDNIKDPNPLGDSPPPLIDLACSTAIHFSNVNTHRLNGQGILANQCLFDVALVSSPCLTSATFWLM